MEAFAGEAFLFDLAEGAVSFEAGEMVALTGESGSGKSTLLYLVAGLDGFDAGEIHVNGLSVGTLSDEARARLRRDAVGVICVHAVPSQVA